MLIIIDHRHEKSRIMFQNKYMIWHWYVTIKNQRKYFRYILIPIKMVFLFTISKNSLERLFLSVYLLGLETWKTGHILKIL